MTPYDYSRGFFLLLHADPPVLYTKDWMFRKPAPAPWLLLRALRRRRAHILVQLSWTHESATMTARLAAQAARYRRRHPRHDVTFLANTPAETEAVAARALSAIYCNGAAFLSPSVFFPLPDCRKEFDAVYDAVISPYKRHELARAVSNLALITYRKPSSTSAYIRKTLADLGDAVWLNGRPDGRIGWVSESGVNRAINRARVGLCLSREEGFMYASAQYLLAGLPVVSTPSVGGRDILYEPEFARIVDEDPLAVADAVRDFCAAPPDPERIRQRTLEKLAEHRARFMWQVREWVSGSDPDGVWQADWPPRLPHKLFGGDFSLRHNLAAVRRPGRVAPWLARGGPV